MAKLNVIDLVDIKDKISGGANTGNNSMAVGGGINSPDSAVPLEIAIANGETFAITHPSDTTRIDGYNCIIIPEAG